MDKLAELARERGVLVASTTIAMGAGFLSGFYFAKKRLEKQHELEMASVIDDLTEDARRHVVVRVEDKPETPSDAVEELIPEEAMEALREYAKSDTEQVTQILRDYTSPNLKPIVPQAPEIDEAGTFTPQRSRFVKLDQEPGRQAVQHNNVWEDDAEVMTGEHVDFDYSREVADRMPDVPYIISHIEFLENEPDHDQLEIAYFGEGGEQVFLLENDEIIAEPMKWIGSMDVLRFGHRSEANNRVYIRNETLEQDYCITAFQGSYAEAVAGFNAATQE